MIKLTELISMAGVALGDYKVHCATSRISPPLDAFLSGNWKEWQEMQTRKNFECDQILSLIDLRNSRWLFAGVFQVIGVRKTARGNPVAYEYRTREVSGLEHLTGRAIIHFNKTFRASYLRGPKYADDLLMVALLERRMTIGEFPGFNSILLSHAKLKAIVQGNIESWLTALGNVAGVYVITDNSTGKQYVGSAYGGVGILGRWRVYTENGHGGNSELKAILSNKGLIYTKNFQYSILEVCDLNANKEFVIARESHWKNVLRTRQFGMNKN